MFRVSGSQLISNGDPSIVKVVPAAEYLEIVAVGYQRFSYLVDFLRLLTLAAPLTEDYITLYVEAGLVRDIAPHTHKTSLLRMLEIVAVTLCNLSIHSLLDPHYLIHKSIKSMLNHLYFLPVAILLHHAEGEAVLGIDDPNQEETVALDSVEGNIQDFLVVQSIICDGYTSSWVCR